MKHLNECIKILQSVALNEAVSNANFEKARDICKKYFIKYGIGVMSDIDNISIDNVHYYSSIVFSMKTDLGCSLLWKQGDNSSELDGIVFYEGITNVIFKITAGENVKSECGINTAGIALTKLIPLIKDVVLGKVKMDKKSLEKALEGYSLNEDFENEMGELLNEESIDDLRKKRSNLTTKMYNYKKTGKDTSEIQRELEALRQQIANMSVTGSSTVSATIDQSVKTAEQELEERATPEERFSDMDAYVRMVCNGVQPSLIVCGAPGVGKSFRIIQQVKKRHTMGDDFILIKGKCTPQKFFMTLFEYHEEGCVVVLDDADDIIKDETCINLLKAATDSSDERWVSYGTSHAPVADDDLVALHPDWPWETRAMGGKTITCYPSNFKFEGSVIVISNMRAGQIDTAIRNRAFICNLEFTTQEVLEIVRGLMPVIMPGQLSNESKIQAYDYLCSMAEKGSDMEISIRSFTACAKIYQDTPASELAAAERRIKEQMKLQFARGGKKY